MVSFCSSISAVVFPYQVSLLNSKRKKENKIKRAQMHKVINSSELRQMELQPFIFHWCCFIFLDACRLLYEYLFEQLARLSTLAPIVAVVSVRLMPRKTMDDLNITFKEE